MNSRFLSVFFVLFILLSQYVFIANKDYATIITLICTISLLLKNRVISYNKQFVYFCGGCFFINFFCHYLSGGNASFGIGILLPLLTITTLSGYLNENIIYKSFKIIGPITILGLVYHFIAIFVFSQRINPIMILPVDDLSNWALAVNRPCSFFAEPQAFCSFIVPFLFLALKRKDFLWAFLITFAMLLSTSSQGILMSLILWGSFLLHGATFTWKQKLYVILLGIVFITFFLYSSVFDFARDKLLEVNFLSNFRIARGFFIFDLMPVDDKLWGIGLLDLQDYLLNNQSIFSNNLVIGNIYSTDPSVTFVSGISSILIKYGYFGFILFLYLIYKLLKNSTQENLPFVYIIIAVYFAQSFNFNSWFIYFFLFFFALEKNNLKLVKIKKY